MKSARCTAIFVVLALLASCRGRSGPSATALMPPLYSYASYQKVQRELKLLPGAFDVLEDRHPLPTDQRPAFRMLTISVKHTSNLGVPGDAQLTFFNDRLMETWFFPDDVTRYRAALTRELSVAFDSYDEAAIAPATRVWLGTRPDGRRYFGWLDKRLQAERNDWLSRYAR